MSITLLCFLCNGWIFLFFRLESELFRSKEKIEELAEAKNELDEEKTQRENMEKKVFLINC